jgi:hypothetical protein
MRRTALLLAVALLPLAFAPAPLPRHRGQKGFVETFADPSGDVTAGYRSFAYEETVRGCKALVKDRRLILRGGGDGHQRLVVTARKAIGKDVWPDALEVTARLGGTAGGGGAWNVGVSVGRVKVLFHPDKRGGAFRAECPYPNYIFNNEDMPFTPTPDVLSEMTIRVRRTDGGYRFEVTVTDAKGGGSHKKTFEVSEKQMGGYDRVGLERHGTGGDALFGPLSIRPGR